GQSTQRGGRLALAAGTDPQLLVPRQKTQLPGPDEARASGKVAMGTPVAVHAHQAAPQQASVTAAVHGDLGQAVQPGQVAGKTGDNHPPAAGAYHIRQTILHRPFRTAGADNRGVGRVADHHINPFPADAAQTAFGGQTADHRLGSSFQSPLWYSRLPATCRSMPWDSGIEWVTGIHSAGKWSSPTGCSGLISCSTGHSRFGASRLRISCAVKGLAYSGQSSSRHRSNKASIGSS